MTRDRRKNRWRVLLFCSLLFRMGMLFRASNVAIAVELGRDPDLTPESPSPMTRAAATLPVEPGNGNGTRA